MTLVVDSSAIVAVVLQETGADWLTQQIAVSGRAAISGPNALETGMVLESRLVGADGVTALVLRDQAIEVIAFDEDLAERAMAGFRRFGKGRHPAALNFGDCCTYALAHRTGWPILCVGDDFAQTDLPVLRPPV